MASYSEKYLTGAAFAAPPSDPRSPNGNHFLLIQKFSHAVFLISELRAVRRFFRTVELSLKEPGVDYGSHN